MSHSRKLILVLVGILVVLSIAGVYVALWCPGDFDKSYDACEANKADLLLRVIYYVEGASGEWEYVACYRHTPYLERLNEKYFELRYHVRLEDVGGPNCRTGPDSGGQWFVTPKEVADGVELSISHYIQRNEDEAAVQVEEGLKIPLLSSSSGSVGKISFRATWERL